MKILKQTSLVFGVLIFLGIFGHGAYTLGKQTEYNRLFWAALNRTDDLPKDFDPVLKKYTYDQSKYNFALTTQGDK